MSKKIKEIIKEEYLKVQFEEMLRKAVRKSLQEANFKKNPEPELANGTWNLPSFSSDRTTNAFLNQGGDLETREGASSPGVVLSQWLAARGWVLKGDSLAEEEKYRQMLVKAWKKNGERLTMKDLKACCHHVDE